MNGLCQISHSSFRQVDIPAPDYDGAPTTTTTDYNSNDTSDTYTNRSYIKNNNMSNAMKEISKGVLKATQDRQPRPEFLSKQHELKTSALKKQEKKDHEENSELFAKLKSRSQAIDQDEKKKQEDENLPEFMKLKLKNKSGAVA